MSPRATGSCGGQATDPLHDRRSHPNPAPSPPPSRLVGTNSLRHVSFLVTSHIRRGSPPLIHHAGHRTPLDNPSQRLRPPRRSPRPSPPSTSAARSAFCPSALRRRRACPRSHVIGSTRISPRPPRRGTAPLPRDDSRLRGTGHSLSGGDAAPSRHAARSDMSCIVEQSVDRGPERARVGLDVAQLELPPREHDRLACLPTGPETGPFPGGGSRRQTRAYRGRRWVQTLPCITSSRLRVARPPSSRLPPRRRACLPSARSSRPILPRATPGQRHGARRHGESLTVPFTASPADRAAGQRIASRRRVGL